MFGPREDDDRAYLMRRAREEHAKAAACADSAVALIHRRMAEEYERRAHAGERNLQLVDPG